MLKVLAKTFGGGWWWGVLLVAWVPVSLSLLSAGRGAAAGRSAGRGLDGRWRRRDRVAGVAIPVCAPLGHVTGADDGDPAVKMFIPRLPPRLNPIGTTFPAVK